jgi:predicted butyrate kinase (DUF1464 family)
MASQLDHTVGLREGEDSCSAVRAAARRPSRPLEGAAIIANGLAGGRYERLVDVLRLRESEGLYSTT